MQMQRDRLVTGLVAAMALSAQAAQVFNEDVIVDGSLAIGLDATSSESFGSDTLRLKENNLRIHFDDSSNDGSFPDNDWRIVINDSSSGGDNFFAIEDSETSKQVFRVDAGSQAHAIRAKGSHVGFGEGSPSVELHVTDGDTPTLRLEQDGSAGWGQATWDVAGNEANFFIRDAKNGSKLPFRIKPGAVNNRVAIHSNGGVGIGLSTGTGFPTPQAKFHVGAETDSGDGLLIGPAGTSSNSATLHVVGTALISGATYIGGTLKIASSRSLKENIAAVTALDAMTALRALEPVHYNYIGETESQLGFIAEDVPDLVASDSRKSLTPMDFTALLTRVTQEQQTTIEQQQETIATLESRLAKLENLLSVGE